MDGPIEEKEENLGEKKIEEEKEEEKVEKCPDPHPPPPAQHNRRKMASEKKGNTCPLCREVYVDIAQHLKFTELVQNKEEHTLLSKLSHKQ